MKPARKKKQARAFAARDEHRARRSKYAAKKFQQATGKPPQPKTKAERRGAKPS